MSEIVVSEIQILTTKPKDGLIAFASFVFNNQLFIGNVAVHLRPFSEGIRLVYPDKTLPTGLRINCVCPINRETGEAITEAISQKYEQLLLKTKR